MIVQWFIFINTFKDLTFLSPTTRLLCDYCFFLSFWFISNYIKIKFYFEKKMSLNSRVEWFHKKSLWGHQFWHTRVIKVHALNGNWNVKIKLYIAARISCATFFQFHSHSYIIFEGNDDYDVEKKNDKTVTHLNVRVNVCEWWWQVQCITDENENDDVVKLRNLLRKNSLH